MNNVYKQEIEKLLNMKKTLNKKREESNGKDYNENELYFGMESLIDMQITRLEEQIDN